MTLTTPYPNNEEVLRADFQQGNPNTGFCISANLILSDVPDGNVYLVVTDPAAVLTFSLPNLSSKIGLFVEGVGDCEATTITLTAYNSSGAVIGSCTTQATGIGSNWESHFLGFNSTTYDIATFTVRGAYLIDKVTFDCSSPQTWYLDADGDGYYVGSGITGCMSPGSGYKSTGLIIASGDCDDYDANVYPGAPEICNDLIDNDCDGQIDEGSTSVTYYRDSDGDGYGNSMQTITSNCSLPPGYVTDNTDCNDADVDIHPGVTEVCDGIDNNCDGQIDEGFPLITYYRDADGDGYGNSSNTSTAKCTAPSGYVTNSKDCNDANTTVHPGAIEICDSMDNNCEGGVDEGCLPITISIADVSMKEGNKGKSTMMFAVLLNKAFNKKVTVQYATQNGTATAGSDYGAKSGTVTFTAGSTKQSINISVTGDKTVEPDETFKVNLSNAVNASIVKALGTGTIQNDDGATAISSISSQTDNGISLHSIKISPNPANGILYGQIYGYTGNVAMHLLGVEGKVLKQEKRLLTFMKYTQQINVADISNGIYFLTVIDEKGNRQTEKVIVQH